MAAKRYMPNPARQRAFALEVVRKLRHAGFESLWAGGCVRDQLLGLMPKDYDVATSALPDEVRELFGRQRTLFVGAAFGVVTVLGGREAGQIDVATFRSDAGYSDGRHPDGVIFTNAEQDAQRRDFTINGLFYDPVAAETIDYVGGQADLQAGVIRAIGKPHERIAEDKLRMLRAVRFAATFDFQIEPATKHALEQSASTIGQVSAERIGAELSRMLVHESRARAIELLGNTKLLAHVLPELAALDAVSFSDTLGVLKALRTKTLSTVLAALLKEVGHRAVGEVQRRLRLTNQDAERARWLLRHVAVVRQAQNLPWPRVQRMLIHPGVDELLRLWAAVTGPDDEALKFCRQCLEMSPAQLNPPPLVTGADLIDHGLQPGPAFAKLLEQIRDSQLEGKISTRDEALARADQLLEGGLDD